MERELELATEIQQRFQPSAPPKIEGYEFQGISFSCYEIGGDYYDFIQQSDGKMLIALGDVSGKGTAAALLMSSVHAAMHAQVSAGSRASDVIVNQYLARIPLNRFVTLFATELDETGPSIINAGLSAFGQSLDGVSGLASGGFPLGILGR
jgi:serine phosphatase RsbU (regulator of sigma subunit)